MRHENIVQLYGYFDDVKNVYLLMELCDDGQLANILK
jgi:serine/threonine protein kinase